jgi:hypothetical protein
MDKHANAARCHSQPQYPNAEDDQAVGHWQVDYLWKTQGEHARVRATSNRGTEFKFKFRDKSEVLNFFLAFGRWHYNLDYLEAGVFQPIPFSIRHTYTPRKNYGHVWTYEYVHPTPLEKHVYELCLRPQEEGVDESHVATMDFRDVWRRTRAPVRKYMGPFTPGRRSEVLYLIANTLREYGATDNEIACVLRKSRAFQSKCEERGARWGADEIKRICAKLRRH